MKREGKQLLDNKIQIKKESLMTVPSSTIRSRRVLKDSKEADMDLFPYRLFSIASPTFGGE